MSSQPPSCSGCPLYGKGTGFVLGSGDPRTAKIGIALEAPGREEILYEADSAEVARRTLRYPELGDRYLRRGVPVVGKSGGILFGWGLSAVQVTRQDLFIDNTLRCLPPKVKDSQYPTGNDRKKAEAWCRQYDRWDEFNPSVSLINIHPAAIAREPTPLPLMIKAFEKAKHFAVAGEKPLVLCGGKAVGAWLGYGGTVQTWMQHYQVETDFTRNQREQRRIEGMKVHTGPKLKKPKKLTARAALELLIRDAYLVSRAKLVNVNWKEGEAGVITEEFCYHIDTHISEEQYSQIVKLIAGKGKENGKQK
jgi:hypothetical protein